MKLKRYVVALVAGLVLLASVGCESQADVASRNLSVAADNFEVQRRVVFFNGITDTYLLEIVGKCSLGNHDKQGELTVTCKVADETFEKHFLGLSDNVSYFAEQLEPVPVSVYRNRIIFRPETILPDIEIQTSKGTVPLP